MTYHKSMLLVINVEKCINFNDETIKKAIMFEKIKIIKMVKA